MRILAILLLTCAVLHAQEIESVRPACAAVGDAVLICGSGFSTEPAVSFGDVDANVLRSTSQKILVRVPAGVEPGDLTLSADGATATFTVLEPDAPVIHHLSASKAHPGMIVYVIGKRLQDGLVAFVQGDAEVATAPLVGGHRVAFFKVPSDLPTGTYTLVFSNSDGADSGACSPTLEVVEKGAPTIESIEPDAQVPGGNVLCNGTSLGPPGFALVSWTAGDDTLLTLGWANGFDRVYTWVPADATGGATYDVVIEFGDGSSTEESGAFEYEVGTPPPPEITGLEYDTGPAGSWVGLTGTGLLQGFQLPTIEFTRDGESTEAWVLSAYHIDGEDELLVQVPPDIADGDYSVTATVGGTTSNAVTFTVADLPLTVTSMEPDSQPRNGPRELVVIEGTGFGAAEYDFRPIPGTSNGLGDDDGVISIRVTWERDGEDPREGIVVFHTDREILVLPPGAWHDPLPVGEYTVVVTVDPDTEDEESATAGAYTVEDIDGPSPGNGPVLPTR
jgi:hypothetical protein